MSGRRAAPVARAPASEPQIKRSSRRPLAPKSLAAQLAEADAEKREIAQMKKALKESVKKPFTAWATELLFWWGFDIVGFTKVCPIRHAANRVRVLESLDRFTDVPLPTIKELRSNYKSHTGDDFPQGEEEYDAEREGDPPSEEESDARSAESESEGEEEVPDSPTRAPKKQKTRTAAPAAASAPATATGKCQHCRQPNTEDFCVVCHLRADLPYDHAQNVDILNQIRQSSASTAAASSKLGKRDTELERQANQGLGFARFLDHSAVSSFEAFKAGKAAHQATAFVPASEALLKLIRSGKLIDVGYALPIEVSAAAAATDDKDATGVLGAMADGSLKVKMSTTAPPITSMHQFMRALVRTILPALAEQPRAMFDWITLTSTLLALDEDGAHWPRAKAYLERVLIHKVHTREEFGSADLAILSAVQSDPSINRVAKPKGDQRDHSGGGRQADRTPLTPKGNRRPKPDERTHDPERPCLQFNSPTGCSFQGACKYKHVCNRVGCGGKHSAVGCTVGQAPTFEPRSGGGSGRGSKRQFKTEA